MAESQEDLKSLLIRVKEENEKLTEKSAFKNLKDHGIWSQDFMASGRGNLEKLTGFIFLGSKATVAASMKLKGTCSLEEKL